MKAIFWNGGCYTFSVSAVSAVKQNKSRNPPLAKKTDSKSGMINSVILGKTRFIFNLV